MAHWFLWQLAPLYSSCLPHSPSVTLFLAEKSKKEEKWWRFGEGESWETFLVFAERRLTRMQCCLAFSHNWNPLWGAFLWDSSDLTQSGPIFVKSMKQHPSETAQPLPIACVKHLSCEFDLGINTGKSKKAFPCLGKKLPSSNNPTQWSDGCQHINVFLSLWSENSIPFFKKVESAHDLSVLHDARGS